MYTRVVTFTGAKDLDAGVAYVRDHVAPLIRQQHGYKGMSASIDRTNGVLAALSLWETEADREASESALAKAREQGQKIIGGTPTVEAFEELVLDVAGVPGVGSSLLIRRVSMDPAKIDENMDFFKREVLPQIRAGAGYLATRAMFDRRTGNGLVGTVWADKASLDAGAAAAEARRSQGEQRGLTFGEQSRREIVFAEMQ